MIKYNAKTINKVAMDSTVNKMFYGGNIVYVGFKEKELVVKCTILTTADTTVYIYDNGSDVLTRAEVSGAVTSFASIKEITVADIVTTIGERAMYNMSNCLTIDLPNTITYVDNQGIYYDNKLTAIYFRSTTPPTLHENVEFYNTNNCPIYVPAESVQAYKTASYNWQQVKDRIQAIPT